MGVVAQGTGRFAVREWLPDDPYPRAHLRPLPELEWEDELAHLRHEAEAEVRRALAAAAEFGTAWPMDVQLSDDPVAACWQLAAITPVGALDQVALLQADDLTTLLTATAAAAREAQEALRLGWPGA